MEQNNATPKNGGHCQLCRTPTLDIVKHCQTWAHRQALARAEAEAQRRRDYARALDERETREAQDIIAAFLQG